MPRVTLYSKPMCSLCDEARAMLDQMAQPYEVVRDPAFDQRVPVVSVDGRVITEGRISARAIRRALRREPPGRGDD